MGQSVRAHVHQNGTWVSKRTDLSDDFLTFGNNGREAQLLMDGNRQESTKSGGGPRPFKESRATPTCLGVEAEGAPSPKAD